MKRRYGDVSTTLLDAALVAATCAYAAWLDEHKGLEPDHTWAEVVFGVVLCLAQAEAQHQVGMGYRRAVWRSFVLGGTPIIIGELTQWVQRIADREAYEVMRRTRVQYRDLQQ